MLLFTFLYFSFPFLYFCLFFFFTFLFVFILLFFSFLYFCFSIFWFSFPFLFFLLLLYFYFYFSLFYFTFLVAVVNLFSCSIKSRLSDLNTILNTTNDTEYNTWYKNRVLCRESHHCSYSLFHTISTHVCNKVNILLVQTEPLLSLLLKDKRKPEGVNAALRSFSILWGENFFSLSFSCFLRHRIFEKKCIGTLSFLFILEKYFNISLENRKAAWFYFYQKPTFSLQANRINTPFSSLLSILRSYCLRERSVFACTFTRVWVCWLAWKAETRWIFLFISLIFSSYDLVNVFLFLYI